MRVDSIHFVEAVPGQPVYIMADGSIRLPFPDGRTKAILWISKKEAIASLTQPTELNIEMIERQFNAVEKEIKAGPISRGLKRLMES